MTSGINAAIDIGSNSIRLLIGGVRLGVVEPILYSRKITRLAGGFRESHGLLSADSITKSLSALETFTSLANSNRCQSIRAVATEALRRAINAREFLQLVHARTGLEIEIIDGSVEAHLCAVGARSALLPLPENYLLFDIGGGSCEFTLQQGAITRFNRSFPLGVVSLAEQFPDASVRREIIFQTMDHLQSELLQAGLLSLVTDEQTILVGTAGTVTTLAAMKLKMTEYDWRLVNNLHLGEDYLHLLQKKLACLSSGEREILPGMEVGRGDLIIPGLEIVLSIMRTFAKQKLVVSDFGLLEGVLLSL